MGKTSEDRFKILISMLRRQEKACDKYRRGEGVDHDLSNVRYFQSHIEIALNDAKLIEISGSVIKLMEIEVNLETILQVHWITCCDSTLEKARLKRTKFDRIYIQTSQELLSIEGMGKSVFPVMKFINWVITCG
jgi:hypothetical protein